VFDAIHHGAAAQIFPARHRHGGCRKAGKTARAQRCATTARVACRVKIAAGPGPREQRAKSSHAVGGEQQPRATASRGRNCGPARCRSSAHNCHQTPAVSPPRARALIVARGEPADLAARSLGHRMRRREHDVVVDRSRPIRLTASSLILRLISGCGAKKVWLARFGDHHDGSSRSPLSMLPNTATQVRRRMPARPADASSSS